MIEIDRQPNAWVLYELPSFRFVLSVLCGGAGLYETNVELDPEEREEYLVAGTVYLDLLAHRIRSTPHSFRSRHIELPASTLDLSVGLRPGWMDPKGGGGEA